MGSPPMGCAPAVLGRFLKPGGRGGRPKLEFAFPTMPLVKDIYARVLYKDPGATLDELREAVTTLEDTTRIARRVLGLANPVTGWIGESLRKARAALRARETPPGSA